jgi:hypothetical protein
VGPAEATPGVTAALAHVRGALSMRGMNGSPFEAPNGRLPEAIHSHVGVASQALAPRIPTGPRSTPAVPEFPAPDLSRATQLFVSALDGADQHALLVDGDGLVLAGACDAAATMSRTSSPRSSRREQRSRAAMRHPGWHRRRCSSRPMMRSLR